VTNEVYQHQNSSTVARDSNIHMYMYVHKCTHVFNEKRYGLLCSWSDNNTITV